MNTDNSNHSQRSEPPEHPHETNASRPGQLVLTDQTNLLPFKQIIAVFSGLALCIVVSALDSVIVATALPSISSAFNAGSVVSWVPSAYLLTSTCFQPLYGRFSDIFGRKSALSLALTIFMIGNLVAGFSKNITQLIVLRGLAGAGGGGIVSMSQIIISDIVSLRDRRVYLTALDYDFPNVRSEESTRASLEVEWLSVMQLDQSLEAPCQRKSAGRNPQWCFWIDIPVAFTAMCVITFLLPLKPVTGSMRKKLMVVDYLGTCLTLAGCALVILPLIWGGVTFPWNSPTVLAPLFSGILVLLLFCVWEWKGARLPIVPMYIFRHLTVSGVYIAMFINGFVFFNSLYYLPQFFQVALKYSPIRAGIFLIPLLVSQMVSSWISGVAISRTGRYRSIVYIGFTVWAIASGCLSTVKPTTGKAVLVIYMLLAGSGAGMTLQTTTVAAQASVPRKDMSVVTAFRNFIRLLGGTLSLAVASTIINNSLTTSMKHLNLPSSTIDTIVDDPAQLTSTSTSGLLSPSDTAYVLSAGYTGGFRRVFILNASLAAVATVASFIMIKHKELSRGDESSAGDEKSPSTKGPATAGPGRDEEPSAAVSQTQTAVDIEMGVLVHDREESTEQGAAREKGLGMEKDGFGEEAGKV